jgi:hypothetical protein
LANVLTIAVAALAVLTTYVIGSRRFKFDRQTDDRKDARATLADGALELGRMKAVMKDALTAFKEPLAGRGDWPSDFRDHIAKLERAKEAVESALAAIRIRFADGEDVVAEYEGACDAVTAIISVYWIARGDEFGSGTPNDPVEDSAEAWTQSEAFDAHKMAFLAAAQKLVGAKLD